MGKFSRVITTTAVALAIGITGCQKKDTPLSKNFDTDRYFSDLKTEKFVIKKAKALDILTDKSKDVDEEAKKAALDALFRETVKFKEYTVYFKDEGGFDKGFAMVKDFAELAPDNDRIAFLRFSTPEQLREMVASGLMLGATAAQKEFPPAMAYIQSAANFIREGGELTISVVPPIPLSADELQSLDELTQTITPDEIVKKLGVSVVHKP